LIRASPVIPDLITGILVTNSQSKDFLDAQYASKPLKWKTLKEEFVNPRLVPEKYVKVKIRCDWFIIAAALRISRFIVFKRLQVMFFIFTLKMRFPMVKLPTQFLCVLMKKWLMSLSLVIGIFRLFKEKCGNHWYIQRRSGQRKYQKTGH
jgi:hypothetical protein